MEGRSDRGSAPIDARGNTPEDSVPPALSPERSDARGLTPPRGTRDVEPIQVSPAADMEEMMILSKVGEESGSCTPEDWQKHYAAYLEDSPIRPQGKRIAGEQNPSPKQQDKVDQHLEKMKVRAEYFFKKTATSNISTEAEERLARDRRAKVEEIIQWARVQTWEGELIDARLLFNKLGTTNPSLDSSVFAELVMDQYNIARHQGKDSWLWEARQMAIMFFPTNWVDSHLKRWTKGRPLVTRRHEPSLIPSTTSMAKDRRVTIDKQSLPCVRSNAAEIDDQGSMTGDRSSANREESRVSDRPTRRDHSRGKPRPDYARGNSKEHSSRVDNRGKPRLSDSYQNRSGQVLKSSHRSHSPQHSRQDYRPSSSQQSVSSSSRKRSSTEGTSSSGGKKYRKSTSHQVCPVTGCGEITKYLKDHVQQRHLPSLYHQLGQNDLGLSNTHRQRLNGLEHLAADILGPNSSSLDLLDYVNSRLQDIIHVPTSIWGPLQGEMRALCRFARWSVPEKFEVFPRVNSPAALIYWRILVSLLGQLTEVQRTEFYLTYNIGGDSEETFPKTSAGAVLREGRSSSHIIPSREEPHEPIQTGEFLRVAEDLARIVEGQVPEDHRRTINTDSSDLTVTIRERPNNTHEGSYAPSPWAAFDSHFHLDRTARKLWGLDEVSTVTMNDILGYALPHPPVTPVNLVGGVMVFCDPETRLSIPLMDGRWKIAVGLHPKKVPNCSEAYLEQIKTLLYSNPLVVALGEIGLDRTVPDYLWDDQDLVFKRMLTFCHPEKVLVLHLRGSSNIHSSDVLMAALQYVRKACSQDQKIHLHCFTGQASDVEAWIEDFPNCHFGFTTRVSSFNGRQQEALRVVPGNRLLIETDSPYMPGSGKEVNTPAYLGDVARTVAECRGISIEELLAVTTTNGRRLYQ